MGQLFVIGAFLLAYDSLVNLAPERTTTAFANASRVLRLEGQLGIAVEQPLNRWLSAHHALALGASTYYDTAHFMVTVPLFVLLYVRFAGDYRRLRNVWILVNGLGLLGYAVFPLAPPRMLPGYTDTVAMTHALGGWSQTLDSSADQLASMPSLHTAWALWVCLVVFTVTRRRWLRGLALAHTALTVAVILGTGNHYVLDVIGGCVCFGVSAVACSRVPASRLHLSPPAASATTAACCRAVSSFLAVGAPPRRRARLRAETDDGSRSGPRRQEQGSCGRKVPVFRS